ncbi:MAG: DUF308 domain-containing protein [Actinobacteria bacterium]|nr:DUF308 domain-containing protein [Actinomycetota bacterium]
MSSSLQSDLGVRATIARRTWQVMAVFGTVSLLAGILALAWPGRTLVVLAVLFGIQLIVSGIVRLVMSISYDAASVGARVLSAILGALGLLVGLYAIRHVVITVLALGLVLGIYWVIDGVGQLMAAIEHSSCCPGRGCRSSPSPSWPASPCWRSGPCSSPPRSSCGH